MVAADLSVAAKDDYATAVAVQTINGQTRIITAGTYTSGTGYTNSVLAAYKPDGTLDTTFGSGGKVLTQVSNYNDGWQSISVLPDGSLLVAGYSDVKVQPFKPIDSAATLAHFSPTGVLDTKFGGVKGGVVLLNLSTTYDHAVQVAPLPNGKIALLAQSSTPGSVVLAVYNGNGTTDTTFGSGRGYVQPSNDTPVGFVPLFSNGLVTGYVIAERTGVNGVETGFLLKLNADGSTSTDPAWGDGAGNGLATLVMGDPEAIAQDQNSRFVVTGYPGNQWGGMVEVRTPSGRLDTTFNATGPTPGTVTVTQPEPDGVGFLAQFDSVVIDASDRILAVGEYRKSYAQPNGSSLNDGNIHVYRFNPDGSQDTGYGTGPGYALIDATPAAGSYSDEFPTAAALQPDGRLVVAGSEQAATGGQRDTFVARLLADPTSTPAVAPPGSDRHPRGLAVPGRGPDPDPGRSHRWSPIV